MAIITVSAVRRRNVSPTSSTLNVQTRDVDCSGMAAAPEDGEFVPQDGLPADVVWSDADATNVTATNANASSLAMVWGSALRSDRQALGDTRVATLAHGGIEVSCALYEAPVHDAPLSAATNFPVGKLVTVMNCTDSIEGATGRLVLTPFTEGHSGWTVGYVTASDSRDPANDRPISVYLYDKPRYHGDESAPTP